MIKLLSNNNINMIINNLYIFKSYKAAYFKIYDRTENYATDCI